MPTELEELVGFIASPNPQIRALAVENLVPFSTSQPALFKANNLTPIKHLKFLVRDHPKISEHAVTMLINLTGDREILENAATDEKLLQLVFESIVKPTEHNSNLLAMLLANLTKWEPFAKDIINRKQEAPKELTSDDSVLNQLMDLFVKGQDGAYNKKADFDYLAYVFADLAKDSQVRNHFLTPQSYDSVIPLSKLKVFTEHKSDIRRKGVASTIKNLAFEVSSHPAFLSQDNDLNILPYILLPIMGSEEYDVDETMDMLPDLQLLPPDKKRDSDPAIIQTHVETLMLLTTTREGRDVLREVKVYPIVRETHARVNSADVKEACDRLVQVLMRDEEGDERPVPTLEEAGGLQGGWTDTSRVSEAAEEGDEDDELVEV